MTMGLTREELLDELRALDRNKREILARLKILAESSLDSDTPPPLLGEPARAEPPKSSDEKINFFLEMFRCRDDLYARRWENTSKGITGYVPALKSAWFGKAGKKAGRGYHTLPAEAFLPLNEIAARNHLEGRDTIGTYAIRKNDSCIFLAADFDGDHWDKDVSAYILAARQLGVEAALERSRSGEGGHAWIFFQTPVPARLARQLGTLVLARASAGYADINLKSYDRLFPNQDTLPKGGFGNLIALPLQKKSRASQNSVFLDSKFNPYPDQWVYLAGLHRLSSSELETVLAVLKTADPDLAQKTLPSDDMRLSEKALDIGLDSERPLDYPGKLRLVLDQGVLLDMEEELPAGLLSAFKRTATFANPTFFERQRLRFSTWNTPRYIFCGENRQGHLWIPRGCLDACLAWTSEAEAIVKIEDRRLAGRKIKTRFQGKLDARQKKALKALTSQDTGVLVAPPGSGKTVVGCALIARRKVSTLVLAHRAPLLEQWRKRLMEFLGFEKADIGTLGGQRRKLTGKIDLAMLQSLAKLEADDPIFSNYGQIIVDECHHIPAVSFEAVLKRFSSRYWTGLTATPFRRDGLQRIIFMQCGPVRYEILTDKVRDVKRMVFFRETCFKLPLDSGPQPPLHQVWKALTKDEDRLNLIASDVVATLAEGRFPLVLTERKDHLEALRSQIVNLDRAAKLFVLVGQTGKKQRRAVLDDMAALLEKGKKPCLLATGSLIGEGFDLPALDTLFLAMPVAFKGKLIQYAGRLHREYPGKERVEIYDYVDRNLALTMSMWRKRVKVFKGMEYESS